MFRFVFFMVGVLAAGGSAAGSVSTCPHDAVSIQILSERGAAPSTLIVEGNPIETKRSFLSFYTSITEHIQARLSTKEFCPSSVDNNERPLLQFVDWGLVNWTAEPLNPVRSVDASPLDTCRLTSPWLDIAFGQTPTPWVRGVIWWNEHQFLADQAILAGAIPAPLGLATPFKRSDFEHYIKVYESAQLRHQRTAYPTGQRIPPELLWLFRQPMERDAQDTFAMHSQKTMEVAMSRGAESYTRLVVALLDHCLDTGKTDIQYNSILDVADLISLEKYKLIVPNR